ncbi:hypothetical protein [Pseudaeromonas paramecii]|uniref:HNH endonuclease n=1 Tax=Pseudaeromonas paramecii TaxID=2138166 RepID=A0ABP8QGY8_9GAMM
MRKNFSKKVRTEIALRSMYVCANPSCLCLTGYSTTEGKARSIAEGAHINAASDDGPRSDLKLTDGYLKSADNGIWLCKICHDKVDDDESYYSVADLKSWKTQHELVIRNIVGKDLESALLDLRASKRHHEETRDLVSFLESKRVLYEGLDFEFPPRVLDSLNLIRERISMTRAKINPNTELFVALNKLQEVIDTFLRNIGIDTDLKSLRCDSRDPKWCNFAEELKKLRSGIVIILKIIAGDAGYKLTWC